jgi:hypothetical protein
LLAKQRVAHVVGDAASSHMLAGDFHLLLSINRTTSWAGARELRAFSTWPQALAITLIVKILDVS